MPFAAALRPAPRHAAKQGTVQRAAIGGAAAGTAEETCLNPDRCACHIRRQLRRYAGLACVGLAKKDTKRDFNA